MPLISTANMNALTDQLAGSWGYLIAAVPSKSVVPPVQGNARHRMNAALATVVGSADYDVETTLASVFSQVLGNVSSEWIAATMLLSALSQIDSHCGQLGPVVDPSIVNLPGFLNYYNGGPGGARFNAMLAPRFADLWLAARGLSLPAAGVLSPAIDPARGAGHMGQIAVGGAYAAGQAVNNALYSEVLPILVVTANFASGTAAPSYSVAGTDHTGALTTTWTVTLDANNPAAANASTITPAITVLGRQTVALGATCASLGIVAGSWLTVDSGLPTQETILVEVASGSNITAVFKQTHGAGAAIVGNRSYVLTPSVGGRRLRSVSNITPTYTGHTAGTVQVWGAQDRVGY